jgi:hypothetical protein
MTRSDSDHGNDAGNAEKQKQSEARRANGNPRRPRRADARQSDRQPDVGDTGKPDCNREIVTVQMSRCWLVLILKLCCIVRGRQRYRNGKMRV